MEVKDKIIVVTGAASGIGQALVRRFAAEGARSVVSVDLNADGAAATAAENLLAILPSRAGSNNAGLGSTLRRSRVRKSVAINCKN